MRGIKEFTQEMKRIFTVKPVSIVKITKLFNPGYREVHKFYSIDEAIEFVKSYKGGGAKLTSLSRTNDSDYPEFGYIYHYERKENVPSYFAFEGEVSKKYADESIYYLLLWTNLDIEFLGYKW